METLETMEVALGLGVVGIEGEGVLEGLAGGGAVAGAGLDDAEVVPVAGGVGGELEDEALLGEGIGEAR